MIDPVSSEKINGNKLRQIITDSGFKRKSCRVFINQEKLLSPSK